MEGRQSTLGLLGEDPAVTGPARRTVALPAGLTLLLLLLSTAGCAEDAPAARPAPPPRASVAPVPAARSCYQLTYAEALAPTAASTPAGARRCGRPHTSETFYVGPLPTLEEGHLMAVDSTRVQRQSARTCPARLSAYVGGSIDDLRLSMLRAVWFTPTVAESDAGAEWLRCDVIAVAGAQRLATVTGSLKGSLAKGAGAEAMCGTAAPGVPGFDRVPCGEEHAWKAIRVVPLTGADYPGAKAAKAAGQVRCKSAGQEAAADALDYSWSYEWPTAEQWDGGQTWGICWVPDGS